MKDWQQQTLRKVVATFCADAEDILSELPLDEVVARIETHVRHLPKRFQVAFFLLLFILEFGWFSLLHKRGRFSRLVTEDRLSVLGHYSGHRFFGWRFAMRFLKAVCMGYVWNHRRLLEKIGYEKPRRSAQLHPIVSLPAGEHPVDSATLKKDVVEDYDVVIIGSGAGGAVVAKELAVNGMRVALLEEGAFFGGQAFLASEAVTQIYRESGLTATLGSPPILVPQGRCLGGSTYVNSGTCFRLPQNVLKGWQAHLKLAPFTDQEMDRLFTKVEEEICVREVPVALMSRINTVIHEALLLQGQTGKSLHRNISGCQGSGHCCYGCPTLAKQSTDLVYLPKALRAGAVIYTRARVKRICEEKGEVKGVIAQALDEHHVPTGKLLKIRAQTTIVCAGTMLTPILLRRSGIAQPNPHLGQHLTFHPATKVFALFDQEIRGWRGTPQAYYFDGFAEGGVLLEGVFMPPDLASMAIPLVGAEHVAFMRRYAQVASFGIMVTDSTEGRVFSCPGLREQFFYSLSQRDVERMQAGIAFLARLFFQSGAREIVPLVYGEGSIWRSLADVERFGRTGIRPTDLDVMAFHPLGTCRMAVTREEGVCDPHFAVYGTKNLYIGDGSVVPTALGVNPQLTIMALATKLAEDLLRR